MDALARCVGFRGSSSYQRYEDDGTFKRSFLNYDLAIKIAGCLEGKGLPPITRAEVLELAGVWTISTEPEIPLPDTLLVIGHIQAGEYRPAMEWPAENHKKVPFSTSNYPDMDVFGLEVRGDSMDRRFAEGTVLVCVHFDPSLQELPIGKYVIVLRRDRQTGDYEVTVKKLEQDESGVLWLIPESTNRRHKDIELGTGYGPDPSGDGDGGYRIHSVVVGAHEVF